MANEFIARNGLIAQSNSIISGSLSVTGSVSGSSFIKVGGSSSEFLKADGSVDSTAYTPTIRTITTTLPITGGGDFSTNRTISMPAATNSQDGYLSSSDWSVFNNKALNYKNTVDTAGYSGTTNTAVYTQLIPANKFSQGDIIRVTYRTKKTGGNGFQTLRIYVNSTPDLLGTPVLIGGYGSGGAISFLTNQMLRHLVIKNNTTNTEVFLAAGVGFFQDFGLYNAVTNAAINWTLDRYFVFAIQSSSLTDVNYGSMFLIEKL